MGLYWLTHQIININQVSRTFLRKDWWLEKMIPIDIHSVIQALNLEHKLVYIDLLCKKLEIIV